MLTKEDRVSTCLAQVKLAICSGHDPFLDYIDHQRTPKKPGCIKESGQYLRPIMKATESCGRQLAVAASLQRATKTNAIKFVVMVSSRGESGYITGKIRYSCYIRLASCNRPVPAQRAAQSTCTHTHMKLWAQLQISPNYYVKCYSACTQLPTPVDTKTAQNGIP